MFDHHSEALPDHDVLHHLAEIPVGHHEVSTHDASNVTEVVHLASYTFEGRLGHASQALTQVIHGAISGADHVTLAHDAVVDAHHGFYQSPF